MKVGVTAGRTTWRTSVLPSKEAATFVLPVKRAVLKAEGLSVGDSVRFVLTTVSPWRLRALEEQLGDHGGHRIGDIQGRDWPAPRGCFRGPGVYPGRHHTRVQGAEP